MSTTSLHLPKSLTPNIVVDDISLMTNEYSDDASRFLATPVGTPRRDLAGNYETSVWLDERTLVSTPRSAQKKRLESPSFGDIEWLASGFDSFPKFPTMAPYTEPASLLLSALDGVPCIPRSQTVGLFETDDAVRVNVSDDSTASEPRPPSHRALPSFPAAETHEPAQKLRRKDGRHNLRRLYGQGTCARRCHPPHLHPRPPPPSLLDSLEYQLTLSVLRELDQLRPRMRNTVTKSSGHSRPSHGSHGLSDTLGVLLKHLGFPTTIFL